MNRSLPALALLLAAAACAVPEPRALPGEARVTKVDRASWQDPPEKNLFRVEFDAARSEAIRRQAITGAKDTSDLFQAERAFLEIAAERELASRGLCAHTAKLVSPVSGIDGTGPLGAIFRCSPPIF